MSELRAYIVGLGLVSPGGVGIESALELIRRGESRIGPLTLFPGSDRGVLPVGQVPDDIELDPSVPRTHALAVVAACEALQQCAGSAKPDAVVVGGTTGGIPVTELLIKEGVEEPEPYRWHGAGTVADHVADSVGCTGPALSVATACSGGAVALAVALELLRRGEAKTVLAGGVDALCRLTYHGFDMLRVIDAAGARPLDAERAGMTVGEGAAMVLLTAADSPPAGALAELRGAGLSCDAYHPSSPHPEGRGALAAMEAALADAGLGSGDVGYLHLHGTGTVDNDAAEAKAVRALFGGSGVVPVCSSVKGSFGHAVGAAGALGAVVSTLALGEGLVPGNIGCTKVDPELGLEPTLAPTPVEGLEVVLANALGFGGNNASVVVARPDAARPGAPRARATAGDADDRFSVLSAACVTGVGRTAESLAALEAGELLAGALPTAELIRGLPKKRIRRVKRFCRLAMALTAELGGDAPEAGAEIAAELTPPAGVGSLYVGTSWGALCETHDFLVRLFDSGERFSSPTDFVGSVHNAVAGQLAMWLDARGENITATTGNTSFEDALYLATLLADGSAGDRVLVIGADEAHPVLTPRLDLSVAAAGGEPADGGGALLLQRWTGNASGPTIRSAFRGRAADTGVLDGLVAGLGGAAAVGERIGALWYGFPAAESDLGGEQLAALRTRLGAALQGSRAFDYRAALGQFPTAAGAAAALAVKVVEERPPSGKGILMVGLGSKLTAVEILPG